MGLGVSTGHPLGIIAAAGMPLACLAPGTRKAAFRSTLGYYVAALWPMIPGLDRYIGQSATSLIPLAIWVFTAILLSVPWTIAWTSIVASIAMASAARAPGNDRPSARDHRPCFSAHSGGLSFSRNGLGRPRGSRASARNYSLDARFGLAPTLRCSYVSLSRLCRGDSPSAVVSSLAAMLRLLAGWIAVNTHFGDVSQPFRDFPAAQFIQQKAAETSARVLIFPESVVPRWSEATEAFWRQSLDRCRTRGQILAIGAGLPAKTRTERNVGKD